MRRVTLGIIISLIFIAAAAGGANAAQTTYVVKPGDNLWSIARLQRTDAKLIAAANPGRTASLKPGDVLVMPAPSASTVVSNRVTTETMSANSSVVPDNMMTPSRGLTDDVLLARSIVSTAITYAGNPYRRGGTGKRGFDCSGFVRHVFGQYGITLPHQSGQQAKLGIMIEKKQLTTGDLVFFKTSGAKRINHVGIFVGSNRFVHASPHGGIITNSLSEPYYVHTYDSARRVI